MFDMKFADGSEAEFSEMSGVRVPAEFRSEDYQADYLKVMLQRLEPGSDYEVKKYNASVKVDKLDPLFVRLFTEDNFTLVEFFGDAPKVPYQNTRSPFIVE